MELRRSSVTSPDGVEIGLVSAGAGPPLLLVHGGMVSTACWTPLWARLTRRHRVTAMDRRGRGSSADAPLYALSHEYGDVAAAAAHLADGRPEGVDVFAHSIGSVCALGAAARGAPIRRLALYEPPGPETVDGGWIDRVAAWLDEGQVGRAVVSFLVEVIGLDPDEVAAMRDSRVAAEALVVARATLLREARALAVLDEDELTAGVSAPVLFLLGDRSPGWATSVTARWHAALPRSAIVGLPGHGHDALDTAPDLVASRIEHFFGDR